MRRMLRVKRHYEHYNFSYGKLKGGFQFYAHKSGDAKEWRGVSSMEIKLPHASEETADIYIEFFELQQTKEDDPFFTDNKLRLSEELSLGAADKPLSVPGPFPRIPLHVFKILYPDCDSNFQLKLTHDLNEKFARIYRERTLVEFGYEIGCGVHTEGEDAGKSFSDITIPYIFGPRENKVRNFDSLKKSLDIELLPAAQQLARKTLLRIQKKPV